MVQKMKLIIIIIIILSCQQSLQNTHNEQPMHVPSSGHVSEVSAISLFNLRFKSTNREKHREMWLFSQET